MLKKGSLEDLRTVNEVLDVVVDGLRFASCKMPVPIGALVETCSACDAGGAEAEGLDAEAMIVIKLRNQCKLQQVAWDKRDDCQ